jgi:isoquinoline 1-oxidoreductase beta subunit
MMKTNTREIPNLSRRKFIISTVAASGGLAVGMKLPFAGSADVHAAAAPAATEVNHWVMIRPDETVVIRIARAEMGQGTHTGLAQLVAEELDCDWKKVVIEPITPGQNHARKRAWGDMSTGGSRGIRTSQDYCVRAARQDA